ncbi:hypothetical protein HZH68_009251 [Vespula germanica]|uniref:Uncharacterized protein n=1 Tax=Vespula germanica TaxID=30212 RepID=A0A834JX30_VESGE|nr:hypothetical protein HZH68_009251 [Vespula germanica]
MNEDGRSGDVNDEYNGDLPTLNRNRGIPLEAALDTDVAATPRFPTASYGLQGFRSGEASTSRDSLTSEPKI